MVFSTPGGNATKNAGEILASQSGQGRKDLDLPTSAARARLEQPSKAGLVSIGGDIFDCNGRSGCEDGGVK